MFEGARRGRLRGAVASTGEQLHFASTCICVCVAVLGLLVVGKGAGMSLRDGSGIEVCLVGDHRFQCKPALFASRRLCQRLRSVLIGNCSFVSWIGCHAESGYRVAVW
jgi:hypothetical protein